ncbi:MAG TPA: hypothetical protein DCY93_04205, partial [Firmicutes bacterium]|nr:hypothetical protein [Bacillota bacterium]
MKHKKLLLLPLLILSTLSSCQKKTPANSTGSSIGPTGGSGTSVVTPSPSSSLTPTSTPSITPSTPAVVCADNSGTPLSDVTAANVDKAFDGTVKVTGLKGSDLYVEDQTGGGF